eukprot:CAMPEP_0181391078 /NCGR_PEP_ID=MMETSP1106-20121128/25844_1 /TAXON_ID=81844 /ORGANISM="Mantoniella antarctica, Strain SL-175" /LENGTH=383 /DNA_ID=CAMNT_0023512067 /DNA_START=252 /DNA_END=1400 /DNA_ORIENTATION=-
MGIEAVDLTEDDDEEEDKEAYILLQKLRADGENARPAKVSRRSAVAGGDVQLGAGLVVGLRNGMGAGVGLTPDGGNDADAELMVVGESGLDWRDLPHNRHLCRMYVLETVYSRGHANAASCENCWCFVCDVKADECAQWCAGLGAANHCNARDTLEWRTKKLAARAAHRNVAGTLGANSQAQSRDGGARQGPCSALDQLSRSSPSEVSTRTLFAPRETGPAADPGGSAAAACAQPPISGLRWWEREGDHYTDDAGDKGPTGGPDAGDKGPTSTTGGPLPASYQNAYAPARTPTSTLQRQRLASTKVSARVANLEATLLRRAHRGEAGVDRGGRGEVSYKDGGAHRNVAGTLGANSQPQSREGGAAAASREGGVSRGVTAEMSG